LVEHVGKREAVRAGRLREASCAGARRNAQPVCERSVDERRIE
jgi:hypothetical protein